MTKRETLIEAYENTYFAVLMHSLAEHEGQQLIEENDRLKNDLAFQVPNDARMRLLNTIKRAFKKEKAKAAAKHAKQLISKIAVVFLIASFLFTAAYAAVPEFRAVTKNLIIHVSEVYTSFIMHPSIDRQDEGDSSGAEAMFGYTLPEIPDGYELRHEDYSDGFSAGRYYSNEDDDYIFISITAGDGITFNMDTENADSVEQIKINGFDGMLVKKNGEVWATLADTEEAYLISIGASNVDAKELLRMLEDIKKLSD